MAIKKYKATSNGRRNMSVIVYNAEITTEKGKCTASTLTPKTDGNGVVGISITTNESYTDSTGDPVVIDPLEGTALRSG